MTTEHTLGYQHILAAVAIHIENHPAMGRAVNIAQKTDGDVSLVHVLKSPPASRPGSPPIKSTPTAKTDLMERARSHLEQLKSAQPLVREVNLVEGRRWSVIIDIAEAMEVDLIVIGSFVHGQLTSLLGETSDRVLHHTDRDVLVIRSDAYSREHPPTDYTHIVAATDLSDRGRIATERAAIMADTFGARLTLVNVLEHFPVNRENVDITPENQDPMKYQQQLRSRKLHALAESIDHPDAVQEVIVTRGSARDAIPAYATEHGADLIIVSSHHGPYGLKVLLGAAVDGILQRAPCDVLVVHAEATAGIVTLAASD